MKKIFIVLISCLTLMACWKKEDPLIKEQKQIKEFFEYTKILTAYKGVKIALRTNYNDTSAANLKISKTSLKTLSTISTLLTSESGSNKTTTISNAYQGIKGLYELQKEINAIEEDDLPTVSVKLDLLQPLTGIPVSPLLKDVFGSYNNSTEHFLLGSLWFVIPTASSDIYTYEFLKVNSNELIKPEHVVLASLTKALMCINNKWFYTSEKNSTECINYLTTHKSEFLKSTAYLDNMPGTDTEAIFYELRGLAYLMRGYAKESTDRTDDANVDFDKFTEDLDKSGIKNKEFCFPASYFCIRNSNNKRAETFLSKIEQSADSNSHDKKMIAELREFIKGKDNKKFNKYFDTFSLSKIACSYLYTVAINSDMTNKLKTNKSTKQLIEMPESINNVINYSGKTLNMDSLVNNSGKIVKDLFK